MGKRKKRSSSKNSYSTPIDEFSFPEDKTESRMMATNILLLCILLLLLGAGAWAFLYGIPVKIRM